MKLIPLGITGLDEILHGGLYKPSTTLIAGDAGAGKTTLIMQALFNAAKELGERSLYISFVSESLDSLCEVTSTYSYYDQKLIDEGKVNIVCLGANILKDGDMAVSEVIEKYIIKIKPDKVVIDPITVLEIVSKSFEQREMDNAEKREFGFNLLMKMKQWDTMVMLTSELPKEELQSSMWSYLVDGIIILTDKKINDRRERLIEITKMRGMCYERGEHSFKITDDGIEVFPRLAVEECGVKPSGERVNSGILTFDTMLGGGLIQPSATLVGGNSGVGKSIMGLHFIKEGLESGESALIVSQIGEYDIMDYAKKFGWDFEKFHHDGLLSFVFIHPEMMADEIAIRIRDATSNTNTNTERVLFDSYTEYIHRISDTNNIKRHMHSLVSNLKNCNITSMFISNASTDDKTSAVDESIAFMMDNIILLGYVKKGAKTKRSLTVLKEHGSNHEKCMREFLITDAGIKIKDVVEDNTSTNEQTCRSDSVSTDLIKILAVDDDPFILTIIEDSLPPDLYTVVRAKNGKEALGMVFSESPDLILLDAMMPDMGGHEVIEKLKANGSTAKIPIIMLTAMSDPQDEIKAIEMGVDDYITKPFEPTVLDPRIRMVLRRAYAE